MAASFYRNPVSETFGLAATLVEGLLHRYPVRLSKFVNSVKIAFYPLPLFY